LAGGGLKREHIRQRVSEEKILRGDLTSGIRFSTSENKEKRRGKVHIIRGSKEKRHP